MATDGQTVFSYFGPCGLFAYVLTGKLLWKYDLPTANTVADFGTGVSPILLDGLVVLQRDEMNEPKIIALDIATGHAKWETKRRSPTSYCTPTVWDTDGAEDGEFKFPKFDELLESGDDNNDGQISREESEKTFLKGFFDSNDTNKDGLLTRDEWDSIIKYMSAGKNSVFAVKAGGHGDITKTHVVWKQTKGMPYVPSAILVGEQYFMVKDGGLCTAYNAKTGKEVYVQKRVAASGRYYASPVSANGNIYVVSLDDGTFTILKAGTKSPEVVVENPKLDEKTSATPAIVGDTIYVRTANHLWAFAEKK